MSGLGKTPFDVAASDLLSLEARRQRLTYKELTLRTGFPVVSIGRYMRGEVAMTVGTLYTLLNAIGVPLEDALTRIETLANSKSSNSA
jgi:transcriptional regulator with XRE-family HTH domain